jgi:hypothetical protein
MVEVTDVPEESTVRVLLRLIVDDGSRYASLITQFFTYDGLSFGDHGDRDVGLGFEHENMRFFLGLNGPCFDERFSLKTSLDHSLLNITDLFFTLLHNDTLFTIHHSALVHCAI